MADLNDLGNKEGPTKDLDPPTQTHNHHDSLSLLRKELFAPCHSLIQYYLKWSTNKRPLQTSMSMFRARHPWCYKISWSIDWGFRMIYIGIFTLVIIRGLALDEYLFKVYDNLSSRYEMRIIPTVEKMRLESVHLPL